MKSVVLLCDGMADTPCPELGGRTPMEAARKPAMDALAAVSEIGLVRTVPDGMAPGSDVANLTMMGYDTRACYTGRSPLEAANIGIDLADDDVAFRCNLVTLSDARRKRDASRAFLAKRKKTPFPPIIKLWDIIPQSPAICNRRRTFSPTEYL